MPDNLEDLVIVTVSQTHDEFIQKIGEYVGQKKDIGDLMEPKKFTGGEFLPKFRVPVKGKNVYLGVTQGPFQDPSSMVFRTATAASAAKDLGANKVVAVMTELPYARQDRGTNEDPDFEGEPNTSRVVAKTLRANGVDQILTMHLHSPNIHKIYSEVYGKDGKQVVYDISPAPLLAHYLRNHSSLDISQGGENLAFISPDRGARAFVDELADLMDLPNTDTVYFDKARQAPNKPEAVVVDILNREELMKKGFTFENKTLVIPDDIIDTGGTLVKVRDWIYQVHKEFAHGLGHPKDLVIYCTHPVLGGSNYDKTQRDQVKHLPAKEYIMTNTRPYIDNNREYRFKENSSVLRVAFLFGDAIVNCCEKNIRPEQHYNFNNFEELDKAIAPLYDIKRSTRHFLEKEPQ